MSALWFPTQNKLKSPLLLQRGFVLVEKGLRPFPPVFLQSAARIICLPQADKFHTCSLRSIFRQVHAPAENDFDSICHFRG